MAELESKVINSRVSRAAFERKRSQDLGYQFYLANKRLIDIVSSIIGLILTLPIMIMTAIAIKLESPGPVIFKQKRVGLNGKKFTIYKFRSMVANAEAETGPVWAQKNDMRVTEVGKFIRKTRIDELPQFVNILKGEMSLVGPRPERAVFIEEFSKDYPHFEDRLLVKPGVTGLAQVTGGYELTPHQKARLDLLYIRRQGLWLDIKVLLQTVRVVIFGDGAR
ncbi:MULTISPECIES: sugar transferase [unclassified Candidatus Frackibacter]|uniref:sugar transferase n=1 Tax=unclassified Candidatus Frackibacter TaxID=2648818 RepID=UPI000887D7FB|nr:MULTISPECIES: sugar transferase [unclassified Candidatus Frackibacter]SDC08202.1 exopolysaccharide biosynthesis polyprenyl glycosylphosphotransferase [Candidatus Frackibacter sp. WG11]SEM38424.1 exopolysaccharide biosynthesis polyprenyl glycosylphosphotransferase [Candidatus Frackibacter sp. WG12]SFL44060.1 exopolysaccharide biosynthesis polyprenyl glycosylphosphotransferase [Candidatus Frackibacter sp. WG13]